MFTEVAVTIDPSTGEVLLVIDASLKEFGDEIREELEKYGVHTERVVYSGRCG